MSKIDLLVFPDKLIIFINVNPYQQAVKML